MRRGVPAGVRLGSSEGPEEDEILKMCPGRLDEEEEEEEGSGENHQSLGFDSPSLEMSGCK